MWKLFPCFSVDLQTGKQLEAAAHHSEKGSAVSQADSEQIHKAINGLKDRTGVNGKTVVIETLWLLYTISYHFSTQLLLLWHCFYSNMHLLNKVGGVVRCVMFSGRKGRRGEGQRWKQTVRRKKRNGQEDSITHSGYKRELLLCHTSVKVCEIWTSWIWLWNKFWTVASVLYVITLGERVPLLS